MKKSTTDESSKSIGRSKDTFLPLPVEIRIATAVSLPSGIQAQASASVTKPEKPSLGK